MRIIDVDTAQGAREFEALRLGTRPIHRIGSGLGNQLFAACEVAAHGALDAVLDVREAHHTQHIRPEHWLPKVPALDQCVIVTGSPDARWCSPGQWDDLAAGPPAGRFRNGWRPSWEMVEASGLFPRGHYPDALLPTGGRTAQREAGALGVHVRRSSELRNQWARIGELEVRAYLQMLDHVPAHADAVVIAASGRVPGRLLRRLCGVGPLEWLPDDPLSTLHGLARAEYLISANSTFSWWAGWFSTGTVIMPSPWYIAMRDFDAGLGAPGWQVVPRTDASLRARTLRYHAQRIRGGIRRRLSR